MFNNLNRMQRKVLDYVACDLAMISESEKPVDAGTSFTGCDYRSRAKALETLLCLFFDFENKHYDFEGYSCDLMGEIIESIQYSPITFIEDSK